MSGVHVSSKRNKVGVKTDERGVNSKFQVFQQVKKTNRFELAENICMKV